ncbi:hypothetical protein MTR_7g027595 [Medicago truncatula]|uniref:Uncharacterized protein n=1 Tax=Medicago truncatula TaxID=3880 RepID=A0A072TYM7_MEDTR|nr:hypothetical protein MTR_7g027595 [Medicago truncatula]
MALMTELRPEVIACFVCSSIKEIGGNGVVTAKTTAANKDKDKRKPNSHSSCVGIHFHVAQTAEA